eukprot:TRINITY_DN8686_c0_g1_i4.p1 TRINITY_DN8686_c0_g1~~TRINITY_DN8686_c0_g1_i4.p1  ORF type:complete len:489 (-),score=17.57 TRINITY_DN8686_c0_g1_i4:182-1648(-)
MECQQQKKSTEGYNYREGLQQLEAKIIKKIVLDHGFSNKRWKLQQKTVLRRLNRQWLNEVDNKVVSLPIKPETDPRELLRIIHWFPNLEFFNDKHDQFKTQLNNEKLNTIVQIISSNLDLQQLISRKKVCIPVFWNREIHAKLYEVVKQGMHFNIEIDPRSVEDILDFVELVKVGFNVKCQIKIRFFLEDLIHNQTQLKHVQNNLIQIKEKISCLEIYSIDQIFVHSFFYKFFQLPNDNLDRLVLHYSFDPKWHKLFSQNKQQIIKCLAQIDNVCQYCSVDESDLRLLGQISFTELVISNAGTATRDDAYFFIVQLQNQVLYPQDILKLVIGPFPVKFFDQMAIQLLSQWIKNMSCLTQFQILNFDSVFIQCFQSDCFQKLNTLVLGNLRTIYDFEFLNQVRNLKNLTLEWVLKNADIYFIKFQLQTPKLKSLSLKNCCCIQQVEGMADLKDFESLQLVNCSTQVSEAFNKELGQVTNYHQNQQVVTS